MAPLLSEDARRDTLAVVRSGSDSICIRLRGLFRDTCERRLITHREDLMGTNLFSGPIVGGY